MLVIEAISSHPLKNYFNGTRVKLLRWEYGGESVAGSHARSSINSPHIVQIFDFAWKSLPQGAEADGISQRNFKQAVAHEFTHVAQSENPQLVSSYTDVGSDNRRDFPVHTDYAKADWNIAEDMALTVSTIVYGDPDIRQRFVGGVKEHKFWFVHWSTTRSRNPRADWLEEQTGATFPAFSLPITE